MRIATFILGLLSLIVWATLIYATAFQQSDPATAGLDEFAWVVASIFIALTTVPALVLAGLRRARWTALVLSLAFPVLLLVFFAGVVMILP